MQGITNDTFGPLIAYLVPGATVLVGLSPFLPVVDSWLDGTATNAPTVGGLLHLSLASLAAGMTVSAVRWVIVDRVHARTGLPPPDLDFARLTGRVEELRLLIEIHYRHYQFYANMLARSSSPLARPQTPSIAGSHPAPLSLHDQVHNEPLRLRRFIDSQRGHLPISIHYRKSE